MFTENQYIEANKYACVHNCICGYLWRNQSFAKTIATIEEYEKEYHYCNPKDMKESILELLQTMITEEGVHKFITMDRKPCVSPVYKTNRAFIIGEYQAEDLTEQDIANIVKQELATIK